MWINAAANGFAVENVSAGGPAEQAGVVKGDIITAINGKPARAEELSDARTLLRSLPAGTTVELQLLRGGKPQLAQVRLRDLI
jgi:S1-C subfamily serine protease